MNDSKRLLLVDAPSYFYRAFHALPEFRSPSGEPTGAILGVVNMLRKLKQDFPSDYIATVFDPKGKTFRDDIYPQYKATRQAMPEPLAQQVEPLLETIEALGWPIVTVDGVEADDVIGTLACAAANATLADHQRIRRAILWPEPALPRTAKYTAAATNTRLSRRPTS